MLSQGRLRKRGRSELRKVVQVLPTKSSSVSRQSLRGRLPTGAPRRHATAARACRDTLHVKASLLYSLSTSPTSVPLPTRPLPWPRVPPSVCCSVAAVLLQWAAAGQHLVCWPATRAGAPRPSRAQVAQVTHTAAAATKRAPAAAAADGTDSEDEGAGCSSADEDRPLPGELDEDSDDELGEDDGSEGLGSGEGDNEEEDVEEEADEDAEADDEEAGFSGKPGLLIEEAARAHSNGSAPAAREGSRQPKGATRGVSAPGIGNRNGPASSGRGVGKEEEEEEEAGDAARRKSGSAAGPSGARGAGGGAKAQGGFFAETPDGTRFSASSFADLHLSRPLLKAVAELGYTHTTPIQVGRAGRRRMLTQEGKSRKKVNMQTRHILSCSYHSAWLLRGTSTHAELSRHTCMACVASDSHESSGWTLLHHPL